MMNERLTKVKSDSRQFWTSRTKNQKGVLIGTLIAIVAIASTITYFSTKTEMVPLFTELSPNEVGQIQEVLTAQGTQFEIAPGGTNILVSEKEVDALKVSLMSQGYPETGGVSTTFFTENAGFGMTDNEFNVIKLAALQTEIADLYRRIDGVKDAQVKVVLPESSVFLSETTQESQAMVMLTTDAGHKFTEEQIKTLYNIVGKSVPNLTNDNIQITNQYGEYFDLTTMTAGNSANTAEGQMAIKKQIERDLQRQVQNMLGTLMGQDKVVVSVSTDIDFKQVNSTEELVEPVDEENIEGIAISAQRITETYSGTGSVAAGAPEAENVTDNFIDYQEGTTGDGEYERVEETINNDVNRIRNEIQGSPFKVRNIGIQVMVEPPGGEGAELDPNVEADIEQILATIVRTSIDQDIVNELTEEQISERIVVLAQPFYGKETLETDGQPFIPWWVWVIGGVLLVAIALLVFYVLRSRKQKQEEEEAYIIEQQQDIIIDDLSEEKETEATLRRKQLEKMAKDKPEDFAKLLRTWIAED